MTSLHYNAGQSKIIVILSGILIAALLAAGAVIFLVPPSGDSTSAGLTGFTDFVSNISFFDTDPETQTELTSTPVPLNFDTTSLQRKSYIDLNSTLIDNGLLPVRPDPAAGKANPFL